MPMTTDKLHTHRMMQMPPQGHSPFCVPDGYFATLQSRVMDSIKQAENRQKQATQTTTTGRTSSAQLVPARSIQGHWFWMRIAAAAIFTGIFSVVGTMLYRQHTDDTPLPTDNITSMSSITDIEYNDDLLDYAMLSNSDIAYYLTSAE